MKVRLLAVIASLFTFVLNSSFGCGEDFEFGPDEMRSATEGVWRVSDASTAEPLVQFRLTHTYGDGRASVSALVRSAMACTERRFVTAAAACSDTSAMTFEASIEESHTTATAAITSASLQVHGRRFTRGGLSLAFESGASMILSLIPGSNEATGRFVTPQAGAPSMRDVVAVRIQ